MRCVPIYVMFVVSMLGTAYDAPAQQSSAGGLVVNGGFELDTNADGLPDGWTLTADPEDRFVQGLRTRSSHTGHYAFCIENAPWRRGTTPEAPILSSSSFDLKPRVTYRISAWLRIEGPLPIERVGILVRTNTEGLRGGRRFDLEVTREWTKHTVNLLTEADTRTGALEIIGGDNWVDRLFIDDLAVTETDIETDANLPLCWHPWLPAPAPIYKSDLTGFTFPNHHPRLGHTPAEIEEIVRSMAGRDIREHAWVQSADPWLERPLFFFAEPAPNSPSARNCTACRARLKPYAQTEEAYGMECPECRTRYTGEKHRCRARELVARDQSNGAALLGQAYALTQDRRYARRAAEILRGFARRYPHMGRGKGGTMYPMTECGYLTRCAKAYDYIFDADVLSAEDHRAIEHDFLRIGAEYYRRKSDGNGRMSNRGGIYNCAVLAIGSVLGDVDLVDHALNSPYSGFHALVGGLFDEDGLTPEGFSYQSYTLAGLVPLVEMAYRLGLNVYLDPAYRRVFDAQFYVLLPGERLKHREDYQVTCRRFAELGRPLVSPFDDDAVEKATERPSRNFEQRGYGVLRTGQRENHFYVSMTYGHQAMWYGHCGNRKFSLVLYANGRQWTPRGRAPMYGHLLGGWSRLALANNTLTVDDMDHWDSTAAGELVAFEAAPRVKMMRASDRTAYEGVTLDRTVFLADGYAVDLSAAHAQDGRHRFDLCYRNFGTLSCDRPFEERDGPLGAGHGYEHLTDVRSTRTSQPWSAVWRDTPDSALKVSVLAAPETEVMACTSPVNAYMGEHADKIQKETVDAVLMRRRGSGTVFGAVWEPYRAAPSISQITSLPVQGQSGTPDNAQGVGLEVTRRGHESAECFLASYSPGLKRFGDVELDGQLAAGRWRDRDSEPEFAQLAAGVLLRRGAHSIEATAPASIYVERIAPGRLRVKTGSSGVGQLTIVGLVSAGARVERDGDGIAATVEEGETLSFDVAEGSTYEVSGLREWTRVSLACGSRARARVAAPTLALGALQPDPGIEVPRSADGAIEGTNKIANASFEINPYTGSNVVDVASPWEHRNSRYTANFAQRQRTGRIGYDYDPSEAHSGEYSVKLLAKIMSGATAQRRIEQKVATSGANKTYTLSAWVKASMPRTKVRLCLYGLDPDWGRDFTGGVSPEFVVGKEWMRISWTRTFGPEITEVYAMVKREYQILGGDVWVDDVQLEEGQRTTDFVADVWTKTAQRSSFGSPGR